MVIQHNLAAINNLNVGNRVQKAKFKATERLSSGHRINRAADDAAGLAISEKMRSRMRALFQVQNNIEDGISLTQTADGALAEVNDMLNRVQELCVQAANGTNTEEDRMMLADEIAQLYDAMEAVFTDTEFNTIPIFRHDGANFYAGRPNYNYTETVTWLPEGQYESWGDELLGITDKVFDTSKSSTAASAIIPLDDTIDVSDASSLVGKNLRIGTCNFEFVDSSKGDKNELVKYTSQDYFFNVDTNNKTVSAVLKQLVQHFNGYNGESKIDTIDIINTADGKSALKINMKKTDLTPSCTIDGTTIQYPAISGGKGSSGNNIVISSVEGVSMKEVDTANNALSFEKATVTVSLFSGNGTDPLTTDEILSLQNNEFYIWTDSGKLVIPVKDYMTSVQTKEEARLKFIEAINTWGADKGVSAEFSVSNPDEIEVTVASNNGAEMYNVYIGDSVGNRTDSDDNDTKSLVFTLKELSDATAESVDVWSLTIDETKLEFPVTFQVGSGIVTIFNKNDLLKDGWNSADAEKGSQQVEDNPDKSTVLNYLASYIRSYVSNSVVIKEGDTLIIKGKTANTDLDLPGEISGISVKYRKQTEYVDLISNEYFIQEYSASLNLSDRMSSETDVTALYGTGFYLNGVSYEFSDASSELTYKDTVRIDISGCDSYDSIAEKVKTVVQTKDRNIDDIINSSGVLTISGTKKTNNSKYYWNPTDFYERYPVFSNGKEKADGLMNTDVGSVSIKTSGGTDVTRPQTSIDFSRVNLDNISELYGKGFRITCATCPGEFINVIFCHDKESANFPTEFEYTDDDGNVNTIKNHVVELKNITTGNQIVDSIAQQLQGSLEHTVTVEPSGASLLVMDKRYGDIMDKNGNGVLQAKILAGVYTNCTYHVDAERIVDKSELVGDGRADTDAYYAFVMIYAGDTEEKPYIPIHLPYLSLKHLKLEYPGNSFQTYEGVTKVMNQAKTAASVISAARSKIGADQNRLEHAFQYAANAEEQVTASYSRIRDTDMAEETVNQVKYNILAEVQQAMLSQISRQPEQVMSLLR